jgi:hypothetical protein
MRVEGATVGISRTDNVQSGMLATSSPAFRQVTTYGEQRSAAATFLAVILASASLTSGVTYSGEPLPPARYISSSLVSPFRRRYGQRVSLKQARQIALQVLRNANQDLREERQVEARFILRFWDEQDDER